MKRLVKTFLILFVFSTAMAFLECAVVVYIRALYYPEGFMFPVKIMDNKIAITEFFREIATLIMLIGAGCLSGKNFKEKFGGFLFSFAIWDIFYYIFLKLILNWPSNIIDWDILFLIPVTWVGPVLAPIINSLVMTILGLQLFYFSIKDDTIQLQFVEWLLLIFGSIIVIMSYTVGYVQFMLHKFSITQLIDFRNFAELSGYAQQFIPSKFNWWIFSSGTFLHVFVVILLFIKFYLNKLALKKTN